MSRSGFLANKVKLNPDKTEFILFGSRTDHTKLTIQLFFPGAILGILLSPPEAIRNLGVCFLVRFFPSHAMSWTSVRLVLFISATQWVPWLQTPWLEVVLTNIIPCLEVSLLLIFAGSSVFKTVFTYHFCKKESSLVILSNIDLFLRWSYWCTSFYIVVIQNNSSLFLNPETVCTELVVVYLTVFYSRPTLCINI